MLGGKERGLRLLILLLLLICASAAQAPDDLKINRTSDINIPGMPDYLRMPNSPLAMTRQSVILVKGSRLRRDGEVPTVKLGSAFGRRQVSLIQQCDLKRTVQLFPKKKDYTIKNAGEDVAASANDKHGGHLDVTVDVRHKPTPNPASRARKSKPITRWRSVCFITCLT
jgi:hypothetical protein